MTLIVVFFGALLVGLGMLGLALPSHLIDLVEALSHLSRGHYLPVGLRVILGVALLVAAPTSRFPQVFQILGAFSLLAAVITALLGMARLRKLIQWWTQRPLGLIRGWSLVAALLGAFLVYGVV